MRKIKDAKDLSSDELIYFKSHAKATYMSDGSTVEDSINLNKLFVEDNYYNKSTVDKKITEAVTGGQVSLDGFATEQWVNEQGFLKTHQDISHLAEKSELPTKTSDLTNDSGFITINDIPEITVPTKVSDLENDSGYLTEHQDISHLATKAELPTVPTKVSELENDSKFITIDEVPEVTVPTKTSDLTNDSGFITINDVPVLEIPEEYVTETELNDKGFLTEHQDISHLATKLEIPSIDGLVKEENLPDFNTFAKTSDIPKLDGYATQIWVDNLNFATETLLADKVDKISGKQLSTEDFTTALKTKLNSLSNYDDTEISNLITTLRNDFNTLVNGDTSNAIKSFNDIIAFLENIEDSESLDNIIASIEQQILNNKNELATVATTGSYNDLILTPSIPSTLSDLSDDTTHRTVTDIEKQSWNNKSDFSGSYNDLTNKPTIPNAVSESTVSDWGFAKSSALQTKAEDSSVVHKTGNETITGAKTFNSGVNFLGNGDSNAVTLSTNTRINVNGTNNTVLGFGSGTFYINHGNYSLLLRGKDTRPTYNSTTLALSSDVNGKQDIISDIETIRQGAAKGATALQSYTEQYTGTYNKPTDGIPKDDLSISVLNSLNNADTSYNWGNHADAGYLKSEQFTGTVTGIKMNNSMKNPVDGVVDLGSIITEHLDITNKQDKLISGTNIKTINGKSILGDGDVSIESNSNIQAISVGTIDNVETNTYVKYVALALTEEQKAQVRENIGVSNVGGGASESNVVKYVNQTLTDEQQAQARKNISAANVYTLYVDDLAIGYSDEWTLEEIDKLLNSDFVLIKDFQKKILCTAVKEFYLKSNYIGYDLNSYPDVYIYTLSVVNNRVSLFYDIISPSDELYAIVTGVGDRFVDGATILVDLDTLQMLIYKGMVSLLQILFHEVGYRSLVGPYMYLSSDGESICRFVGDFLNEIITCDIDFSLENQIIHITPKNTTNDLSNYYTKQEIDSSKQDKLVSGTNIKTINGESIIGGGDIVISVGSESTSIDWENIQNKPQYTSGIDLLDVTLVKCSQLLNQTYERLEFKATNTSASPLLSILTSDGDNVFKLWNNGDGTKFLSDDGTYKEISGGGSSSGSGAYAEIKHGTSDTTFTLTPNTFHIWDEVTTLDLSFGEETEGVANEFLFQFTSGTTATTLTLPDSIKWANDEVLTIEANMIYQVSILKGLASVLEFINPSIFPITLVLESNGEAGIALYEYLYNNYGETTSTITEEIYNHTNHRVESIEYGTYNEITGYWLNGYNSKGLSYCLQSSGFVDVVIASGGSN